MDNDPLRIGTYKLRNPDCLRYYLMMGYTHIRRVNFNKFEDILRDPTIGCVVELFRHNDVGCVSIHSIKARKLIRKISYF